MQHNHYISRCPVVRERAAPLPSIDDVSEAEGNGGFVSVEHLAKDTGVRFEMPKQQRRNTDLLLQKMFDAGTRKAGQTKSQADLSFQLASTCDSVCLGFFTANPSGTFLLSAKRIRY